MNSSRCGAVCDTPEQATQWIGWLGAIIAILFFGSNFVPVKTFDTGDGELLLGKRLLEFFFLFIIVCCLVP